MGLFLRGNHLLTCWGYFSILNWVGAQTSSLLLKLGALICSLKFLSPVVSLISINITYGHAWSNIVMSELLLLDATWNC